MKLRDEADDSRTVGRRLKELRVWRGKSQRVIAELAGISEGYLSRLEHGHSPVERRSLIVALANALDIAPSELTKLPLPAPGNGHTDSATDEVRRALVAVDLGRPGGEVFPIEELRGRVTRLPPARRRQRARGPLCARVGTSAGVRSSDAAKGGPWAGSPDQ